MRYMFRKKFLAIALCSAFTNSQAATFTNIAEDAGLANEFHAGESFHILGLNWIDFNNDTYPDLFVPNGKTFLAHLYMNNAGDGTFTQMDNLLPVLPDVEMAGSVFADYDNDGDMDIYIFASHEFLHLSNPNPRDGAANMLLKNMWMENGEQTIEGQPLFVDVAAEAGVTGIVPVPFGDDYPAQRSMTGGWLDYDLDGCIDLYVGNMVLETSSGGGDEANRDVLYKNNCDGTFTDVTATAVNDGTDPKQDRPALAFIGAHLDDDNYPDMYVANVHEVPPHSFDLIYMNNRDGTFTQVAHPLEDVTSTDDDQPGAPVEQNIGDDAQSAMGIDISDIDRDGDWDIYLSDVRFTVNDEEPLGNPLYLSNGDGTWSDNVAEEAGVVAQFSWAVNFFDIDQDGWDDLFVGTNGANVAKFVYMNNGDGTFTQVNADEDGDGIGAAGIETAPVTRGAAYADFDKDGDLDLATINQGGNIELYRNDTPNKGNWIQVRFKGAISSRDAIGTRIVLRDSNGRQMRQIIGGSSTHSQNEMVAHFGIGSDTEAQQIRVAWPSGERTVLSNVAANQMITLIEGGDTDGDGVSDLIDNCVDTPNPDQSDIDNDGIGDACDDEMPAPEIASVSPRQLAQGSSMTAIVTGSNFQSGATLAITPFPGGVSIDNFTVDSDTQITMQVSAAADASIAIKSLEVTNPDGQSGSIRRAFRVVAP